MHGRPGLTAKDMYVLRHYADHGNRELYWNYLAQQPGNDGYGQLALGVVRNDNMPGATANVYAQNYARDYHQKTFTEREWDNFGIDLIQRDLAFRQKHLEKDESEKALNLPADEVQKAHEGAFNNLGIDADAWTPNRLMNAARQKGEAEATHRIAIIESYGGRIPDPEAFTKHVIDEHLEAVWSNMLDNGCEGIPRAVSTTRTTIGADAMSWGGTASYLWDMGQAYRGAASELPNTNPHDIGRANRHFVRSHEHGDWVETHPTPALGMEPRVTIPIDEPTRRWLEDTHQLRHEREAAHDAFHPDDPGKHIPSPHPLASTGPRSTLPVAGDDPIYAAIRHQLPIEVTDDKAAEAALMARRAGIHDADHLPLVDLDANDMIVCGTWQGRPVFMLDAASPAPPREESLEQAAQLDQQAQMQQDMQMQQQMQMDMQAVAQGPLLSLSL
ncbi:hypothetical protein SAMN02800694_1397 [Luteibacter sp. UNCMF331Sha3.1]|uniref:hypothetical protein n=1 Tax=Luteibacter sp. UNCMF331Sha3.1 TaxID=1502760 RepID=UPI0008B62BF0|nr:hypothetical protein [Luteibacter sp. UNCMF331Sha3.1]SEM52683.1 hypothetical protein SAMN02800694_1397 [Luteibacter sp. UNCMF331Sha3.1]